MSDEELLVERYLAQLAELGGSELYLDTMTPSQLIAGLRARAAGRGVAGAGGVVAAGGSAGAASGAGPAGMPSQSGVVREALLAADNIASHGAAGIRTTVEAASNTALPILAQRANVCTLCRLWEGRTHAVFGEGSSNADLLVVGEAPGEEEDRTGRPFVGRAGKLLDLLLLTAGFPREDVYICNVLKCRPPGNRNPMPDEAETCTSNYLFAQLDAIAPRAILAAGKFAAQALLNTEQSIGRLRGTTHTYRGTPLVVTYHPAYLLRSPQMTRVAWDDFQLVRRVIDGQV